MMRWVPFAISVGVAATLLSAADDLPEGKGSDVVLRMCVSCHEVGRVTSSRYTRKQWSNVVDDMVSRGAEGSEADVKSVVGYLTRNFGTPVNINSATAQEIESGLSFTAQQSELLVRYRADKGPFKTYEDLVKVPGLDAATLEEQKKNILF
jgi:competence protein ComEA